MKDTKKSNEVDYAAPIHLQTVQYVRSQTRKSLIYSDSKCRPDFAYGSNHPFSDASGSRGFLPREILNFANRMQSEDKVITALNRTLEGRWKKDSDWRSMARQFEKSIRINVRDNVITSLIDGKGASGGRGIARALGMYFYPNALPRSVQDVLAGRVYDAGSGDHSESGMSLFKDAVANGSTRTVHDLVGSKLVGEINRKTGTGRGAVMETGNVLNSYTNYDQKEKVNRSGLSVPDYRKKRLPVEGFGEEWSVYHVDKYVNDWLPEPYSKIVKTHRGKNLLIKGIVGAGGTNFSFPARGAPPSSVDRLDWAAQSRAVSQAMRAVMIPLRRHEDATKQPLEARERNATEAGIDVGYLARPQRGSLGVAVRSVGDAGHSAVAQSTGHTMSVEARYPPRGEVARLQATRTPLQGSSETQVRARLSPADFAALREPPYLAAATATSLSQSGCMVQAAAAQLPTWMNSRMSDEAGPRVAMAPEKDRAPSWVVPAWTRLGGDDGTMRNVAQLMPMQTLPAAPGAMSTTGAASTTAVDSAWSSFGQDRRNSLASLPGTRAAWDGPAREVRQILPTEDAASASFDAANDARRQMIDEMTRLASRPPAGMTGFDAGQMPAWLGGWTGGV